MSLSIFSFNGFVRVYSYSFRFLLIDDMFPNKFLDIKNRIKWSENTLREVAAHLSRIFFSLTFFSFYKIECLLSRASVFFANRAQMLNRWKQIFGFQLLTCDNFGRRMFFPRFHRDLNVSGEMLLKKCE